MKNVSGEDMFLEMETATMWLMSVPNPLTQEWVARKVIARQEHVCLEET